MIRSEFLELISQKSFESLEITHKMLSTILAAQGDENTMIGYRHYYGAYQDYLKTLITEREKEQAFALSVVC